VDYLGWRDASLWAGWQIPKCTVQSIPDRYQDRMQKKIYIFCSGPLPDLRPDLGASGYSAFAYMFGFLNISDNHTVMVSCNLVGAGVGLPYYY
jgi:hypothetical protein